MLRGRIHGSEGGLYRVVLASGEKREASLRGRLKRQARTGDKVVIGDEVGVLEDADGSVTIEEVYPRKTEIVRRGPGGRRPKVVAANVQRLIVVAAVTRPEPRQPLLDRLLVMAESNGLESVLVFNKMDLLDDEGRVKIKTLTGLYSRLGYPVLHTSAEDGSGLDALMEVVCRGTSALVGPSGVGKSRLLNAIQPGLDLRIGDLSLKRGRGRHTTVSGRLIQLDCGGLVADTPGFSDVGVWGVDPRDLEPCFPEFSPFREGCQFRGCSHLHEPGCAVREALAEGTIDPERFSSYATLIAEARSP